ncbi:39230_t:CDS:2, partial [Gigaspora margarita]
ACMDVVGKVVALQDENMKIINTLHYCANHLKDCPYFAVKYSPEQIQNIIDLALAVSTSKKHEDEEEDSISTTSTHSLGSFLKKQSTLSQYIGRPLNAFEVPKFEQNPEVRELFHFISPYIKLPNQRSLSITIAFDAEDISLGCQRNEEVIIRIRNLFEEVKKLNIRANCLVTDSAGSYATLVTKDDAALDNNLILPSEIKVTVNCDSFWELLVMLQTDDMIMEMKILLRKLEFEEEQDDFDKVDIDFFSSEIHSAKNQAAKWELQNLFLPNLPFTFENI